jgi:amino-acid N-acetyltransferase
MTIVTIERAQPADHAAILALPAANGLPDAGLAGYLATALVAREGATVIGCAALEVYGPVALLRSVAVRVDRRGAGLGRQLTEEALALARQLGVAQVYLLTETAQTYFPRMGFRPVARADVHPAIHRSLEWTAACPASAQAMVLDLIPTGEH